MKLPLLLVFVALAFLAGCGEEEPETIQQNNSQDFRASEQVNKGPAYNKEELTSILERASVLFRNAPRKDKLDRVAGIQYAIVQELMVVARALDTEGAFKTQIEAFEQRFLSDSMETGISRRLTDSNLGIYSAFALLYTMRFQHAPEKLEILKTFRSEVEEMMERNTPIIQPMARMSEASYLLIKEIMKDIDKENNFAESFAHSESLYQQGRKATSTGEDRYINGVFRIFEISQLWALFLSPDNLSEINAIKSSFQKKLLSIETVGDQMALGVEYIYRMLELITRATITVTFSNLPKE